MARNIKVNLGIGAWVILGAILIGLGMLTFFESPAKAGEVCEKQVAVGCNPADIITFNGDRQIPDQIEVKVCHGYWNLLDPGQYNGRLTKWWAPVMVYGTWYGDLPVVTNPCKTYWVKPGSELRLYADCVERVISTGKMTRPGRYDMT